MANPAHFALTPLIQRGGGAILMPILSFRLSLEDRSIQASGLLDTGATLNVLPYDLGLQLGAIWENQTIAIALSGAFAGVETRALFLTAQIAEFAPVTLAFAWTRTNDVRLILGQYNFFYEFDLYFSQTRDFFEIAPKLVEPIG